MLRWIAPFHKRRRVAVADEQRLQLLVADAGQEGRVIDLVAVQVQDRQHRPVRDRVEELVAVPARGQRTRLRFPVTHHHERDQVRPIVDSPVSVRDAVAQLHRPHGCFQVFREWRGCRFRRGKKTA